MLISKEILKTLPIGQIIKNDLETLKNGRNGLFSGPITDIGEYGIILFNKSYYPVDRCEYSETIGRAYTCYEHTRMYGECLNIDGIATVRAYESKVGDGYFWREPFDVVQAPVKYGILQMDQFEKDQFILIEHIDTCAITKKVKTKHSDNFELEL